MSGGPVDSGGGGPEPDRVRDGSRLHGPYETGPALCHGDGGPDPERPMPSGARLVDERAAVAPLLVGLVSVGDEHPYWPGPGSTA